MKTAILTLLLACLLVPTTFAQSKVKKRDLRGTWKLVIEIDEEEGDNMLERAALGAVDGILSGIDVSFQFEKNNELKVTVLAFGEEEVEYSNWKITDDGGLYIGDNDHIQMDEDTIWYMEDDRLKAHNVGENENGDSEATVYLERRY